MVTISISLMVQSKWSISLWLLFSEEIAFILLQAESISVFTTWTPNRERYILIASSCCHLTRGCIANILANVSPPPLFPLRLWQSWCVTGKSIHMWRNSPCRPPDSRQYHFTSTYVRWHPLEFKLCSLNWTRQSGKRGVCFTWWSLEVTRKFNPLWLNLKPKAHCKCKVRPLLCLSLGTPLRTAVFKWVRCDTTPETGSLEVLLWVPENIFCCRPRKGKES